MTIINFTPWTALIGGILIGTAGLLLLWLNGRMAGISGIFGSVMSTDQSANGWRILFVLGLIGGGFIWAIAGGDVAAIKIEAGLPELIGAGLLVGFGTQLGRGCTSGHGVCGISRLSPRGIISTLFYMGAGALTVFVIRHVVGA